MNGLPKPIFSVEAEKSVIGSVLINPEVYKTLDLQPADFYQQKHQQLWAAFQDIIAAGKSIDLITVCDNLAGKKLLDPVGGQSYVMDLISVTPSSVNCEDYAGIVRSKAQRRELLGLATEMAKSAYDQDNNLETEIPSFLTRLVAGARVAAGAEHISVFLGKLYDDVEYRIANPKDIYGIPTGFLDYDFLTGGLQTGELTILSGEPGLGKSILAMQMAHGMAQNSPGAFYEMEMGDIQTLRRLVSSESHIEAVRLKNGRFANDDWQAFTGAMESLEKLPVYMDFHTSWTTASLRADLARLKSLYGITWFVVDYLYLLNDRYGRDDYERIAYVSKALKNICKDLDLAGLAIHSMTKSGIGAGEPNLGDLRGSGQLAYDADVIIFLVALKDNKSMVRLSFQKFREDAPNRHIELVKVPGFPMFGNVERKFTLSPKQYKED